MDFLANMDPMMRTLWYIAIVASAVFVIQTIITFIGMDSSDGIDADFDSDLDGNDAPYQLFSFRNLINFFLGFGWSGIAFYDSISNRIVLILTATLIGLAFVALFFVIIKQIQRFAEDNSFKIEDTIHKTGSVYIPIPAKREGYGKIQISVKGAFHELDAITTGDKIDTGIVVRVTSIESTNIVVVEKV